MSAVCLVQMLDKSRRMIQHAHEISGIAAAEGVREHFVIILVSDIDDDKAVVSVDRITRSAKHVDAEKASARAVCRPLKQGLCSFIHKRGGREIQNVACAFVRIPNIESTAWRR